MLLTDNWDDYGFKTQYYLRYCDDDGIVHDLGQVKIGRVNQRDGRERLPTLFEALPEDYFSLGQDDSYYQNLSDLGNEVRETILEGLRDLAIDTVAFLRNINQPVVETSLLRTVRRATVEGQFHRLAKGGVRLTKFWFSYTNDYLGGPNLDRGGLEFAVLPGSLPPTNIHVIIGRNGVGKTRLLNHMAQALTGSIEPTRGIGLFEFLGDDTVDHRFVNLVLVTFSAFDPFRDITPLQDSGRLSYSYVGLRSTLPSLGRVAPLKDDEVLASEFAESVIICLQGSRRARWKEAIRVLESDPAFAIAAIGAFTGEIEDVGLQAQWATEAFNRLSAGHKIVLLTLSRLIEKVDERTLVLLDEPEAHLHPPLLAAFIRALSDLLVNRNGVAIVATHSPVILQEVPKRCVWKLRRSGRRQVAERPRIETFGENVGVLTREVFGLEITRSGFHQMLATRVSNGLSYEDIVESFSDQLGGEAKGVLRGLIAIRDNELSL